MRNPITRLRRGKALTATPGALELLRLPGGFFNFPRSPQVEGALVTAQQASYAAIYAGQPNVRTAVDYIARVSAARELKLFERLSGGRRAEDADHPAAMTLARPNDWQGQKEILGVLVRDWLVYDNAYLWDMGRSDGEARFLVRVPPYAMRVTQKDITSAPVGYRVLFHGGSHVDLKIGEVVHFRGYAATDTRVGTSPMETLRQQLVEESTRQAQAIEFVRGGMVKGGIIQRPLDAPEWSNEARERFESDWAGRLKGVNTGKSPVLEEGMVFVDAGVSPKEAEAARNREFTLSAVARLYGLHPSLFGVEGTSAADLGAARDAMEEDVVAPLLGRVAETFTVQFLGTTYGDNGARYFAFGPRGETSIEKLFQAGKAATQGPVMTVNEFRALFLNLPPVAGGDELMLNPGTMGMQLGGEPAADAANPERGRDEGERAERPAGKAQLLARRARAETRRDAAAAAHADLFRRHFRRQRKHVAEGGRNLDAGRWDDELAGDLLKLGRKVVSEEGAVQAERLMGTFDAPRVENYLATGAKAAAGAVNAQTARAIAEAKAVKADDVALSVLDGMISERADELGFGRATQVIGFATFEAAKQLSRPGELRVKTWVGSGLPASRHTGVSGESVPLFAPFSNGLQYPGDPSGSAGQTAGCRCLLDVT